MPYPIDALSVDQHTVASVFKSAVEIRAQDIRLTAYRPDNSLSITFKIVEPSGRTDLVRYRLDSDNYKVGLSIISTLFSDFCAPAIPTPADEAPRTQLVTSLGAEWLDSLGLQNARILLKPVRDGQNVDGCVVVVNLDYPTARTEQAA